MHRSQANEIHRDRHRYIHANFKFPFRTWVVYVLGTILTGFSKIVDEGARHSVFIFHDQGRYTSAGPGLNLRHFLLMYMSSSSGTCIKIQLKCTAFEPSTDTENTLTMDISLTYRKHGCKAKILKANYNVVTESCFSTVYQQIKSY